MKQRRDDEKLSEHDCDLENCDDTERDKSTEAKRVGCETCGRGCNCPKSDRKPRPEDKQTEATNNIQGQEEPLPSTSSHGVPVEGQEEPLPSTSSHGVPAKPVEQGPAPDPRRRQKRQGSSTPSTPSQTLRKKKKTQWNNYDNSFSGNIDNIPYIGVDNFYEAKKAYFLSHFHADHTGGLIGFEEGVKLRNASKLKQRKAKIYMSKITEVIFERTYKEDYNILKDQIESLDLDSAKKIDGIKSNDESIELEVTLIPVDHMPGAVMFLFKVPIEKDDGDIDKRTILYTGDFVITNDNLLEAYPSLHDKDGRPIHIDEMYCDNTHRQLFKGPLNDIPSRSRVLGGIGLLPIRIWLKKENNAVAFYTFYKYGYEALFEEISRETGQRVSLSDETRLAVYSEIFNNDENVYTGEQSRIHVYDRLNPGEEKQPNMNVMRIHVQFCNRPEVTVLYKSPPVCLLNYPTHCSRTQLDGFVEHFNTEKQLKIIKYFAKKSMV